MEDWNLLDAYLKKGSEEAFSELVKRHLALVYSAAMRVTGGNGSLAEEVAQKTFCLLARKASSLSRSTRIGGWLYQTACHLAREAVRSERRRSFHETQSGFMAAMTTDGNEEASWR